MATISTRRLDSNHDVIGGGGLNDFATDLEAVAQIIDCRLLLFKGEWWQNQSEGLPLFQEILAKAKGKSKAEMLITDRIRKTPYVTDVLNVVTSYDGNERRFAYQCEVVTAFGTLIVTNQPEFNVLQSSIRSVTVKPSFNIPGGIYPLNTSIVLTSPTKNAVIYYTTDGSTPDPDSDIFAVQILLTRTMTIKAIAQAPDYQPSELAQADFVLE